MTPKQASDQASTSYHRRFANTVGIQPAWTVHDSGRKRRPSAIELVQRARVADLANWLGMWPPQSLGLGEGSRYTFLTIQAEV